MTTAYQSIACSLYDVFEAAAMKSRTLRLTIDGAEIDLKVRNIYARGREEFLEGNITETGEPLVIRLDQIQSVFDPCDNKIYVADNC